jgi:hypothetical protein
VRWCACHGFEQEGVQGDVTANPRVKPFKTQSVSLGPVHTPALSSRSATPQPLSIAQCGSASSVTGRVGLVLRRHGTWGASAHAMCSYKVVIGRNGGLVSHGRGAKRTLARCTCAGWAHGTQGHRGVLSSISSWAHVSHTHMCIHGRTAGPWLHAPCTPRTSSPLRPGEAQVPESHPAELAPAAPSA